MSNVSQIVRRAAFSLVCVLIAAPLFAQARPGTLRLLVRDETDLTIPGATATLTSWARLRVNYSHQIGRNLFRSRDLNAPVDGVRPDPTLRNITQLESTARSHSESLEVNVMLNYRPRRFSATVGYTLGEALNEIDGPLTLPPSSFDLSQEWGPSRQDVRHRLFASMNTDLKAGCRMNMNLRAQSAAPYNSRPASTRIATARPTSAQPV
jgi:hypothetical protein